MPKSLNDNIENWVFFGQILSYSHLQVTGNHKLNKHARWISNLLLCADWLLDSKSCHQQFLPWVCRIVPSWSFVLVMKWFLGLELIESWWRHIFTCYFNQRWVIITTIYNLFLGVICVQTSYLQQNWVILGMAFPIWISFWCLKTAFDDPKQLFQTGFFQYVQ